MNAERGEMYEELDKWVKRLKFFQELANEMDSQEQDIEYINRAVSDMVDAAPDDEYSLTFHDHRSSKQVRLSLRYELVSEDETQN